MSTLPCKRVPMPLPNEESRWLFKSTGTVLNVDSALLPPARYPIAFGSDMANKLVLLKAVTVIQVAGAAVNFQPEVWDNEADASGIGRRWQGASVGAAAISQTADIDVSVRCDVDGNVWFAPNPDAAADSDYDYVAEFSPVRELV